ncbi:carbohydrate ABC transporter permease [Lichenicoccus sp.]|uniref:carbohydrate ABC transporter permease n=1 Tax=Lichenicoccus sp. TaxID=2781899 RepID=UPI003D0E3C67
MTTSVATASAVPPSRGGLGIVLLIGIIPTGLVFLFPFFWMVSNALRPNGEVLAVPPHLIPSHAEWSNFLKVWLFLPFGRFFLNSALVAGAVSAITLVVSSLSGYAFARLVFPFRNGLFLIYIGTLMIPPAVLVIPLFLMMNWLGWVNTYQALILPMAFSSFGTFLLRQFFMQIPRELEEAAQMDGASRLRILVDIILPLSIPALGLLALFTFTAQWNSFLWPLIVVTDPSHTTLPLGITQFQSQQGTQWNYLMAGTTIAVAPGVLLTILLQRYIFRGFQINAGFGGR